MGTNYDKTCWRGTFPDGSIKQLPLNGRMGSGAEESAPQSAEHGLDLLILVQSVQAVTHFFLSQEGGSDGP